MLSEIILPNRYRELNKLVKIEDNKYKLISKSLSFRVLGHKHEIHAVDPSGGPFLQVGEKCVQGLGELKEITQGPDKDYILEFEPL